MAPQHLCAKKFKRVIRCLGYYDELLTLNVYTDSDQIISHGVPVYDSFIDEILPSDEPQVIERGTVYTSEELKCVWCQSKF